MKIKPYVFSIFLFGLSFQTFAAPATTQQIEQLVKLEHWDQFKPALLKQSMPNMKAATEELMLEQIQQSNPQPITADQQVLIIQISDIMINDMIERVDEQTFLNNIRAAYQTLSKAQAAALLNVYKKPHMQNAGKNIPVMIAHMVDASTNDFNKLISLTEIQDIIRENQQ